MKLLTEELRKQLPPLYSQEHEQDPIVICKFFHPLSHWTWYAYEGSPVDVNGYYDTDKEKVDFLFFGWVYGDYPEFGYFSLSELESITDPLGLGIERDLHFSPTRLSEVKKLHPETPPRQPDIVVYIIEEPEPDFSPIVFLAERMATLYLAVNYKRAGWITGLDETGIHEAATAAFSRIAPVVKSTFDVYLVEMAKEVFVTVFESQATKSLSDYLLKWHGWQRQQQPKDGDDE